MREMKFRIAGFLAIAAVVMLVGCNSLGRVGQGVVGLVAPEYKATADNFYQLLLDDQLAASLEVEVVLESADGQIFRKADLRPVVLTSRRAYEWSALPRGAWQRFLGEGGAKLSAEQEAQRNELSNALKQIPTTNKESK